MTINNDIGSLDIGDSYTWKNVHTHCFETGIIVDINDLDECIMVRLPCGTVYCVGVGL